jgi:hypothetical protein
MATVSITIDGTAYTVTAPPPFITVQDLINSTIGATPSTSFGINRHSLTVLTDTGGTAPSYLDVKNNTVEGHYLLNLRGGEVYASSSSPAASSGATKQ